MADKTVSLEFDVKTGKAEKGLQNVEKEIKDIKKETKGAKDGVNEFANVADKASGGIISSFKGVLSSVKSAAMGFRTLAGAISATGIGLLVIAIGSLTAAFTASEEGQNKFAKIMGVIGAITANFIDLLAALGDKIIWAFENPQQAIQDFVKLLRDQVINRFTGMLELVPKLSQAIGLLFRGEFAEAGKVAADAVGKVVLGVENVTDKINSAIAATKEFIAEQIREAEIAAKIADQRAKADKIERDLLVQRAKANRDIAELRTQAAEVDQRTTAERIALLEEAQEIQNRITEQEIAAAIIRRDAQIAENAQALSNKEALLEEEKLKARVIELDTQRIAANKELAAQVSALRLAERMAAEARLKEIEAELKVIEDAEKAFLDQQNKLRQELTLQNRTAEEKELIALQNQFNERLKLVGDDQMLRLQLESQFEIDKAATQEKFRIERDKAEDEANIRQIQREDALRQARLGIATQAVSSLQSLGELLIKDQEKAAKFQKTLAVTQLAIDTAKAISGAVAQAQSVPFPGNILAIATGVATVLANIAKAKALLAKANVPSPSLGGGAVGGGGGAPQLNPPTQASTLIPQGQGLQGQPQQPVIKAIVTETDITATQKRINSIQEIATLR